MVDARYNERMVEHLRERWLLDVREEPCGCCKCGDEPTLYINGELYCDECGKDEYHYYGDYEVMCESCDEEVDDCYKVGNEYYCEDCFLDIFRR